MYVFVVGYHFNFFFNIKDWKYFTLLCQFYLKLDAKVMDLVTAFQLSIYQASYGISKRVPVWGIFPNLVDFVYPSFNILNFQRSVFIHK